MGLQYILQQVGYKIGKNPSVSSERAVMLRFVNEAARELYGISDMAGVLEEQLFKVNNNQTIAFPPYIGQLRALRESYSHIAGKLAQMRPRYNQFNWEQEWREWRLKGLRTLSTSLENQSVLTITVPQVENPPQVVSITGPTSNSTRASETIIMTSTSMNTVNQYLDVSSFTRSAIAEYDTQLLDVDGNQISYIPNNELKAQFQIIDISTAPWITPLASPLLGWVEVLYKKALPWLSLDTDEFPAIGYDNVIVNKCLQLYFEEQNNIQVAAGYYQKAMQTLAQIHEDANRGTDDTVALVEHPHDKILPQRTGFGRDWYSAYRITGR